MLELEGLNYFAIAVAWLINVVVGAYWYSPMGFGKAWSKATKVDIMKIPPKDANKIIGFVALSAVVQAYVLAIVINSLNAMTAIEGATIGLVVWAGLTAATTVGNTLYQKLGWKYWWINASYFLLVMVVNSVMLTLWK